MNPLDALANIHMGSTGLTLPVTPTTPSMPGAPVGEAFQLPATSPLDATPSISATPAMGSADGPTTWGHMMQQMVMDVNSKQVSATQEVNDVLQGGPTPVHKAMIDTEEASLSFEFLSEMRNKVVDAYQQIMQMQV